MPQDQVPITNDCLPHRTLAFHCIEEIYVTQSVPHNVVGKPVGIWKAIVDNLENIYQLYSQKVLLSSTWESWEY